jgi:hypothetical protein
MSDRDVSHANSEKLDRLLELVKGSEGSPGLVGRMAIIERVLFGPDNAGGLVSQHQILWKIHLWLIGIASGGVGVLVTLLVQKVSKFL